MNESDYTLLLGVAYRQWQRCRDAYFDQKRTDAYFEEMPDVDAAVNGMQQALSDFMNLAEQHSRPSHDGAISWHGGAASTHQHSLW